MWRLAFCLGALLFVGTTPVFAQDDVLRGATVIDRPRPDYDPLGQQIGGFILYPDLTLQEDYESNIYATQTNAKGDFVSSIQPSLNLKSNWNTNALNFHATSDIVKYATHDTENYTTYDFGTDGRLDIYHDARAFAGAGYSMNNEPRFSPNNLFGTTPTEYSDVYGHVAGEKEFNRLSFRLDGNFDKYNFNDVNSSNGSVIPESLRDYNQEQLALRTGYEFLPDSQVYVLTSYNWRNYDSTHDIFGFDRNSTGYTAALGAKYDLTGIVFLDVFAGYREQDYQDARLQAVTGPTVGAKLTWNVTRLTTITGSVTRDVDEIDLANSSGYFATRGELRVDHELLRNVLLNASVAYENDNFQGIGRIDNYYVANIGAKYLIDHNFWVSAGYNFQTRASNQTGNSFDDHIFLVRLSAHL